jgi:hypothetical protein
MTAACATDFDDWLVRTFGEAGAFTVLIVLVEISANTVGLLRSSHLHVIGDETRWPDMVRLFDDSGADWNGAVFFQADVAGLIDDALSILNHGEFFDARGLRLKIEEIGPGG